MRMRYGFLLFLCFCVCEAQSIPAIHGRSFAGKDVNLPLDLKGKFGVLVVGFSKTSGENAKVWGQAITGDLNNNPQIVYYQIPVLAGVPSIIRGVVLQGMRLAMTAAEQAHFVPALQDEVKWKEAVHFTSPDDAYVLVLNSDGTILWRAQGSMMASFHGALVKAIGALR